MTSTGNAVGMEPQSGGMRHENSTIGRLEAEVARFHGNENYLRRAQPEISVLDLRLVLESLRHSVEREAGLREALVQADLTIRSFPGADQSHVEFIRAALDRRAGT